MLTKFFETVGAFVIRRFEDFGTIVLLYVDTMKQLKHKPRIGHIVAQMSHLGVDSLAIVSLTLLFTGVVFTLQTAHEFIRFGAQSTSQSAGSSVRYWSASCVQGVSARR